MKRFYSRNQNYTLDSPLLHKTGDTAGFRKRVHPNGVAKIAFLSPAGVFESPLEVTLLVFLSLLDCEGRARVSSVECRRNEGAAPLLPFFPRVLARSPSARRPLPEQHPAG